MSEKINSEREPSKPDVNIKRSDWSWMVTVLVLITMLSGCVMYVISVGPIEAIGRLPWEALLIAGGLLVIIVVAALLLNLFRPRWLRIAMRPEQELTRGDLSAADRAYEEALSYALGYPPDSEVRGAMFCQLGLYLMARGRRREADVMLQDGVSILKRHSDKNPLDYHIALNNLAIFQTEGREFEAAQRTLEKALDAGPVLRKAHAESPELELVLHLNLVNLLVNMRCLDQARPLLIEAERLLGTVGQSSRQAFRIKFLENRSLWHCAIGDYAAASSDASDAGQTESAAFLWVQAKVHLARNEFAQAEPLLRQSRELVGKTKTLHCPENLEPTLDLAEAQFGQAKHSDAFATLQDARSIVADFALPPDAIWKKSLETWLQRARDVGKMDIATTLQAELATIPAAANQAFTVLEKFRISDDATGG